MPEITFSDDEATIHMITATGSQYFPQGTHLIAVPEADNQTVALIQRNPGTYHLVRWKDMIKGDQFIGYFNEFKGKIEDVL